MNSAKKPQKLIIFRPNCNNINESWTIKSTNHLYAVNFEISKNLWDDLFLVESYNGIAPGFRTRTMQMPHGRIKGSIIITKDLSEFFSGMREFAIKTYPRQLLIRFMMLCQFQIELPGELIDYIAHFMHESKLMNVFYSNTLVGQKL